MQTLVARPKNVSRKDWASRQAATENWKLRTFTLYLKCQINIEIYVIHFLTRCSPTMHEKLWQRTNEKGRKEGNKGVFHKSVNSEDDCRPQIVGTKVKKK